MPKTRKPYPPEFREQMVALVQPAPAPFRTRLLVTHQLREENVIKNCLGPKP